jgi:DNA repair protein RadC
MDNQFKARRFNSRHLEDQIIGEAIDILRARMEKEGDILSMPDVVKNYLLLRLAEKEHEVFGLIYLDSRNRVIDTADLFRGSLAFTAVVPREVVKECLNRNAASVVIYHNHPGGTTEPSPGDIALTKTLIQTLRTLDIRVHDHIIVCGSETYSFAENCKLPKI